MQAKQAGLAYNIIIIIIIILIFILINTIIVRMDSNPKTQGLWPQRPNLKGFRLKVDPPQV